MRSGFSSRFIRKILHPKSGINIIASTIDIVSGKLHERDTT